MGVQFDRDSAIRISRAVRRVEGLPAAEPFNPSFPFPAAENIVQGTLDASLSNSSTADLSVYLPDGTDSTENIEIAADDFVGYVYQGTWCFVWDDGEQWRLLAPLGHMGFGQADGAISQDSTGTVSVYYFNAGTWTDTTDNITCRAIGAIASGDRVAWQWDARGQQFIAGCAASA